nr:hypothetical protein [Tanacetum cinerariifolium]
GLLDQRRQELDAAQLIYTEADWLELMAKIVTNSALSKPLLVDDVNEENINERLVAADVSVPAVPPAHAAVSVPADIEVHTDESRLDDPHTASEHVSTEPTVDETTPSSSRIRRKHLAKKRVTPIVDIANDA